MSNFFSELLPANNEILKNSFILYTSDHGQGVENGTFHGGDFLSHATVPMMLIGNFENKLIDTSYKAHHSNIFPTLLELMGIDVTQTKYNYDLSLLKAQSHDSKPRYFIATSSDKLVLFDQ